MPDLRPATQLQLFVHCATSVDYLAALNASIPGVERYAERALLLAGRRDVVCVTDEIEADYLDFLADLGLGPDRGNVLAASRFGRTERCQPLWQSLLQSDEALDTLGCLLRRHGSGLVHPFIASPGQFELAAALELRSGVPVQVAGGNPQVVAYADLKHHIRAKAIELGVPVAPGEVVELGSAGQCPQHDYQMLVSAIERRIGPTGRAIIRGTSGAAGSATFCAGRGGERISTLARRLAERGENRIYLVESMVEMTASPNVQMQIDGKGRPIECTGVTDQRWERTLVHAGNLYPSRARCVTEMVASARTLAEWLRNAGFVGVAGFDFVEYLDRSGIPRAFLAEVNPRVNGATYPLRLAERLNAVQREAGLPEVGAFVSGTIKTQAKSFTELRDSIDGLLFSTERGVGLVPYVTGCLPHGKCGMVALAESSSEAEELFREVEAAGSGLRVSWAGTAFSNG